MFRKEIAVYVTDNWHRNFFKSQLKLRFWDYRFKRRGPEVTLDTIGMPVRFQWRCCASVTWLVRTVVATKQRSSDSLDRTAAGCPRWGRERSLDILRDNNVLGLLHKSPAWDDTPTEATLHFTLQNALREFELRWTSHRKYEIKHQMNAFALLINSNQTQKRHETHRYDLLSFRRLISVHEPTVIVATAVYVRWHCLIYANATTAVTVCSVGRITDACPFFCVVEAEIFQCTEPP